jgi:hypothetical protein
MANKIPFTFTWCDYLTPCPHNENVCVGDYDCFSCKYFDKMMITQDIERCGGYEQYCLQGTGFVVCNKK